MENAKELYFTAMSLDSENPQAPNSYGMRLFRSARYAEAIPMLTAAVEIGRATSIDYSYLASAYSGNGNAERAEKTLATAKDLYPRSAFVLVRYASLLKENGNESSSAQMLSRAKSINVRATNTWWTLINSGPRAASDLASGREDYVKVMDLRPEQAIYAVIAEREIRFPNEKVIVVF
jgi:Tfp pilus assembly protein PilF